MTTLSFVRTRYDYDSYVDFWRLVELSGFPWRYVDEVDVGEKAVFILSPINGEWGAHMESQRDKDRRAHLVLWDLERPLPRGGLGQAREHAQRYLDRRLFDEIWVSDRLLARECSFRFVVMGSDERLAQGRRKPGRWEICHFSYVNARRETILNKLAHRRVAPNGWGRKRARTVNASRFGLSVHQDGQPYQEPLRLALFAAYGLPTISEHVYDPYPWTGETMTFASYPDLVETVDEALDGDYGRYEAMGERAKQMMCCHFRFREQVLGAVESIGSPVFPVGVRKRGLREKLAKYIKRLR